jgi:hypothetical protein
MAENERADTAPPTEAVRGEEALGSPADRKPSRVAPRRVIEAAIVDAETARILIIVTRPQSSAIESMEELVLLDVVAPNLNDVNDFRISLHLIG